MVVLLPMVVTVKLVHGSMVHDTCIDSRFIANENNESIKVNEVNQKCWNSPFNDKVETSTPVSESSQLIELVPVYRSFTISVLGWVHQVIPRTRKFSSPPFTKPHCKDLLYDVKTVVCHDRRRKEPLDCGWTLLTREGSVVDETKRFL